MKKIWNQFKNWKYFKVVVVGITLILLGWLLFALFVRGHIEFRNNEETFLKGVKKYYEYNPTKLPGMGGYKEVKLSEMFQDSWVESLYVPGKRSICDGESFIRVINHDGQYRYITYLKCGKYESKVDHTAPDIILNGEETEIIHLNETYEDKGVKEVKDNKDKIDISSVKIDTSKVNTSKMGTYEVTYRVYDKNYNASKKVRTVIVAETLSDHIKNNNGASFIYKGAAVDNYVQFSGMLFRIVKLDEEGNIQLIADNPIANISYSVEDTSYKDSNIYKWLNEYFYSNIHENSKKYIVDSKWCYDDMPDENSVNECNSSVNAKVGLLSLTDYKNAIENGSSYLVNPSKFSLLNRQSESRIWVSDIYNENVLNNMDIGDMPATRPVFYLSKEIFITSGNGTLDDPYKLQDYTYAKENDLLNTRLTGEYVTLSGYTFRISGRDDDGNTKLIGIELLQNSSNQQLFSTGYSEEAKTSPNVGEEGNLYYSLNQDAINYISEKSILSHEFEVPIYQKDETYDQYKKKKITSKISLPASFEMFSGFHNSSGERQIYWLSDYSEEGIITIINGNNGIAFRLNRDTFPQNAVKPVIYVKNSLKIASGKGTVTNPYYVR